MRRGQKQAIGELWQVCWMPEFLPVQSKCFGFHSCGPYSYVRWVTTIAEGNHEVPLSLPVKSIEVVVCCLPVSTRGGRKGFWVGVPEANSMPTMNKLLLTVLVGCLDAWIPGTATTAITRIWAGRSGDHQTSCIGIVGE